MERFNVLKVTKIDVLTSKDGVSFKKVTFRAGTYRGDRFFGGMISGVRNLWPAHEGEVNGVKTEFKGDTGYDEIMVGDEIPGTIQKFRTTPYQLDGKTLDGYTCVVFEHENPLAVAAKNLKNNNAYPIDEDGQVFKLVSQTAKAVNPVEVNQP